MLRKLTKIVTAGLLLATMFPAIASAEMNEVTVRESDVARQAEGTSPTKNWVIYTRTATPGTATFKAGPSTPPLGSGSLELTTTTGSDKVYIFNYDYVGDDLSELNALSYETYRSSGDLQQVAAINMQVDVNGSADGGFTTLVFEPVYNTDQGAVESDEWQRWDAYNGGEATWWSTRDIEGVTNNTYVSWDTIVSNNPDAEILAIGINQGSGNPNLTSSVDALTIGISGDTTVYNFEGPKLKATSKDECKNGGYMEFEAQYKNQGDCVSAVASEEKARGNPEKEDNSVVTSIRRFFGL